MNTPQKKKRSIVDRCKDWALAWLHSVYAYYMLFFLCILDGFILPITTLFYILPMAAVKKEYAKVLMVSTLGSTLGAIIGYVIGYKFRGLADWLYSGVPIAAEFGEWGNLYVFISGVTPLPFQIATIVAGILHFNIWIFILCAFLGRLIHYGMFIYGLNISTILFKKYKKAHEEK